MSDKIESKSFSPIEKTSGQMNDAPNNPAELNSFVKGLFIFFLVTSAINCLTKFATNLVHGNITLGILMFVLEVACCIFLYMMIKHKGWAVLALFGVLLLQIPLNLSLGNPDMQTVYISTFLRIIVFSILLLIPKNGVMGWSVLFKKKGTDTDGANKEDACYEHFPKNEALEITKDANPQKQKSVSIFSMPAFLLKKIAIPIWGIALLVGFIAAGILLGAIATIPPKAPEFFYIDNTGRLHANRKCTDGLVFFKTEYVYRQNYPEEAFCAKCISPRRLKVIMQQSEEFREDQRKSSNE